MVCVCLSLKCHTHTHTAQPLFIFVFPFSLYFWHTEDAYVLRTFHFSSFDEPARLEMVFAKNHEYKHSHTTCTTERQVTRAGTTIAAILMHAIGKT